MGDNGQGGAMLRAQVKDQTHRLADCVVRIEDALARRVIDQAYGETHPELALARFGQLATEQALAQPVELGLTHGAHKAEQEPVVILPRIVAALVVKHQCIGQGTDLEQVRPVAA